jgi:hypothetical protein
MMIQTAAEVRKPAVGFDITDYKVRTARLDVGDIDFDAFVEQPLRPEARRCLRYMHDVEYHTVCYLRDLLLTPAHKDPEVTAFLSFWVFEEFWHGEAIGAVLAAHGEPSGEQRLLAMRRKLGWKDRVAPFGHMMGSALAGKDYTAVHMTWGAINEWCTQAGYARLSTRADHPELTRLLGRIMKQEGRHIDFYATQAAARLDASARARKLTRFALRTLWGPVGAGVMPEAETDFVIRYLFGDDEGAETARRIDRRVDRLPGLAGLGLIEGAAARTLAGAPG